MHSQPSHCMLSCTIVQLPVQIQHGNEATTRCRRMLFTIKHCNTDIDNADAITR